MTREPLIYDSTLGNPRRMTSRDNSIINHCAYEYRQDPSVTLTVESGLTDGNISVITDTRKSAGATSTSVSSFPSESTTQEPQTVTVNYNRITQTAQCSPTSDGGRLFPVYLTSGGNIQAIGQDDVNDTFLHPAIDKLIAAFSDNEAEGGTVYTVGTSTSLSNCTLVSSNPIFTDTRADTSAYTSSIPETADQPNNYY